MDAKLMTDNKMERSVMELLTEWFSSSDDASREQAKEVLMRHGIKPSQDCFMVCHLHSSLCKVFSTTAWSLNFSQILERIKDAKRTTARYGMGYNPRRSVSVPWLRYTSPDE
jgi:hypothetical protein